MSRLIIVNRVYNGRYLNEGENIGHEIINLIRSDNDNNYIWLNDNGLVNNSVKKNKHPLIFSLFDCIISYVNILFSIRRGLPCWKSRQMIRNRLARL